MLAILNSLNAHNFLIFQPIVIILVSNFMVYRALSDTTYLSLGLLSPLISAAFHIIFICGRGFHTPSLINVNFLPYHFFNLDKTFRIF